MNALHLTVAACLVETARTGERPAVSSALTYCRLWISSTSSLPPLLRYRLAKCLATWRCAHDAA